MKKRPSGLSQRATRANISGQLRRCSNISTDTTRSKCPASMSNWLASQVMTRRLTSPRPAAPEAHGVVAMRAQRAREEFGRHLVVLLVGLLGQDRHRGVAHGGDEG